MALKEIFHILWSRLISLGYPLTFCSEHLSAGIKVRHDKNSDFMNFACYISSDFSLSLKRVTSAKFKT